jgi:hypothetical protein
MGSDEQRLTSEGQRAKPSHGYMTPPNRPVFRPAPKAAEKPPAFRAIKDLLPAVSRLLHLDTKVNELAVLTLWKTAVPEAFREKSKALRVMVREGQPTVLKVRVSDNIAATELGFHLSACMDALNRYTPQTGIRVDRIQLSIGRLDAEK